MTPAAGDFKVEGDDLGGVRPVCPICGAFSDYGWSTIRELIGESSQHIRLNHPVSAPAVMIAP